MTRVAVVVPVGPLQIHLKYLGYALDSLRRQNRVPELVVLVDDMAGLSERWGDFLSTDTDIVLYEPPWRLGVAAAFNAGVAVAFREKADVAIMLGADDMLAPDCVEELVATYEASRRPDERFYWFGVRYSDDREDQFLPCHAAAVTPGLWRWTGGFTPEMGLWAPDAAFISCLLAHDPGVLCGVAHKLDHGGHPLYWHRVHEDQETAQSGQWAANGLGDAVRGVITESWKPAEGWGRYE